MFRHRKSGAVAVCAAIALSCATAGAVTLDWDTNTWTNANNGFPIPNNYEVDSNNTGTDLTITMSGQISKLRTDPVTGILTPAVMSMLQGGLAQVEKSLHIYANVGTQTEITVSVAFSPNYLRGVENVSFKLFDIDKTTDAEFIKDIYGIALDGSLVAATITGLGSNVSLTGTGFGQLLTGNTPSLDTSGNGNVTISFGANVIKGFAFTFDNSSGPPRVQEFALHDINFTPVPEINPAFAAVGSCLTAIGLIFHHRARVRAGRK
jgi:hypothetical protein